MEIPMHIFINKGQNGAYANHPLGPKTKSEREFDFIFHCHSSFNTWHI